jgi:hypothetical protein
LEHFHEAYPVHGRDFVRRQFFLLRSLQSRSQQLVNASPITCPFDSGNGLKKHVVKFTPTPIKHWCHDEEGRKPRGMKGEKGSRGEEGPKGPPRPRNT